jgi:alanyl-tRNA synthetase
MDIYDIEKIAIDCEKQYIKFIVIKYEGNDSFGFGYVGSYIFTKNNNNTAMCLIVKICDSNDGDSIDIICRVPKHLTVKINAFEWANTIAQFVGGNVVGGNLESAYAKGALANNFNEAVELANVYALYRIYGQLESNSIVT